MNNLITQIKKYIRNYAPDPILDFLRSYKKKWRHNRYVLKQSLNPVIVTLDDLVNAFRAIGITDGSAVYMFSSMSSFGHIESGPKTVIHALEKVVGSDGLIAMPAFPIIGSGFDYLENGHIFDVLETPSTMGTITETFRRMPDVVRSLHPTHSICVKGRDAAALVKGHENCETPFGYGSPFMRMIEQDMTLVGFGVGVQHFTLYHTFEDLCGDKFPLKVYHSRIFEVPCINENREEKLISTRVHDPSISRPRIDNNPNKEAEFRMLLESSCALRSSKVGKGELIAINARDLIAELYHFLDMGITIYG